MLALECSVDVAFEALQNVRLGWPCPHTLTHVTLHMMMLASTVLPYCCFRSTRTPCRIRMRTR
jgi:hypothetical protein